MNINEPRIVIRTNEEGRVVLSMAGSGPARTLATGHARNLAGKITAAADRADEGRASADALRAHRNRLNVRPGRGHTTGLVRLSIGSHYVDVEPTTALTFADRIVDAVEAMDGRATDAGITAEFTRLAEAAAEEAGQ